MFRITTVTAAALSLVACGQPADHTPEPIRAHATTAAARQAGRCELEAVRVAGNVVKNGIRDIEHSNASFLAYDCGFDSAQRHTGYMSACHRDMHSIADRSAVVYTGSGDRWLRESLERDLQMYKERCP